MGERSRIVGRARGTALLTLFTLAVVIGSMVYVVRDSGSSTVTEVDAAGRSESFAASGAPAAEPSPDVAAAVAAGDALAGDSDLGVAVLDLETGGLTSGAQGSEPFYSASLSKLLLVVDLLDRRTDGELDVPESDLGLVRRALSLSDDAAMDVLWDTYDGPGAVERVAGSTGLTATAPPDDPSQWGEVTLSADDAVRLCSHVLRDMAAADRDLIVDALSGAREEAADGTDQYFGLLADGTGSSYAKQGWMIYLPSDVYAHSAGVVDGRYAVALLSIDHGGTYRTSQEHLDEVADAVVGALRDSS
jgi:hypothetical protein